MIALLNRKKHSAAASETKHRQVDQLVNVVLAYAPLAKLEVVGNHPLYHRSPGNHDQERPLGNHGS